ncbi:bifunctional precorrin-2 dehydrogenase/sirohydrochlorin ferrochelatase [Phototrophicus methaneseepsis]|uniref:precorrin-2 dehydrogenase n=1 Tax=Phototrophicus methaneseepsis TaxID=2710758 RepID=A0A7S8IFZ0_9CHLR|nr:bifunctional precorrin-2 dehydrogenase/sirohydrochlorin ferrochelatase [Phototrophicus methaneseepsis]QPC84102.1 bifunctional precorrin-2 dehydrogenase/sirohydrochlorin ferrochelatase [Phototrophicus methaneseepsis]
MNSLPLSQASPYLVALNMVHKAVVIVGGGVVASRKIGALLASGARVTVISPMVTEAIRTQAAQSNLQWIAATYEPGLLAAYQPVLVIAATDDSAINQQVRDEARQLGAWVNDVSAPDEADFANMAVIDRAPLQIGISSGGASPALLRWLKQQLTHIVDVPLGQLASWMQALRGVTANSVTEQAERQRLYDEILASDVLSLLRDDQPEAARQRFEQIVQAHLPRERS